MANDTVREQTVRTDMESIFGPPKVWYAAQDLGALQDVVGAPVRRHRSVAGARLMATAGAFLALAIGVGVASGGMQGAAQSSAGRPLVPTGRAGSRNVLASHRATPATPPQPQVTSTVIPLAAPGAVALKTPKADHVAFHRTEAGLGVAAAAAAKLPAIRLARSERTPSETFVVQSPTRVAEPRPDQPCHLDEDQDRCIYRDVLSADARLRVAYATAIREGTPVGELAAVRRRWLKARDVSLEQPDEAIRRYDELAGVLRGTEGYEQR